MVLDGPKTTDDVFEVNDLKLIMDKELHQRTSDVTVDYVARGVYSGFQVTSTIPVNSGSSCGSSCSC